MGSSIESIIINLALALAAGLLGLAVGGAINLLADELPQRESPRAPRCIQCRYEYGPAGWLALSRQLFFRGRCPSCGLPTRRRAVLVEIITALIFAALPFLFSDLASLFFGSLYIAILILVIVTDVEHRLILHVVTVPGTLLALLGSFFISSNTFLFALIGVVSGFLIFYTFYWFGRIFFGPGALGFGDVTLSAMLGAMVGFPYIIFALVIGILFGGLFSLLLILSGRLSMRSYVAYGPYLALAGILVILWGEPLLEWYIS